MNNKLTIYSAYVVTNSGHDELVGYYTTEEKAKIELANFIYKNFNNKYKYFHLAENRYEAMGLALNPFNSDDCRTMKSCAYINSIKVD